MSETHAPRSGRRGRAVRQSATAEVAIVVAIGLAILLGGLAPALASRTDTAQTVESVTVVVREGDTLWSLARASTPPGGDIRETLDAMCSMNDLNGGLTPGTAVIVPLQAGESRVADR